MAAMAIFLSVAGAAACGTARDCSLNGVCITATTSCKCDLPWTGPTCGVLRVMAVNRSAQPGASIYGWAPNVSSWGGTLVTGADGEDHLFVAQMKTGGLIGWGSQSECVHATGSLSTGRFTKQNLVLPNECHGPVLIQDPTSHEYLLYHIGDGGGTNSSFMHHSASLHGPWIASTTSPGSCGMPTAGFHPNGTLFVICGNGHALVRANQWDGEWTHLSPLVPPPGWEDPTLYFDGRGNWHIIYHVYALRPFAAHAEIYSGHAFSVDGWSWTFSTVEPFGGSVNFTDGTSQSFATRERPQLLFQDPGRHVPVGFTSAVSSQPIGSMCDTCKEHACSQCKVSPGRDWTYTIFQPLEGYIPDLPQTSVGAKGLVVTEDGTPETYHISPMNPNVKVVDDGGGVELGFGTRAYVMVTPNLPKSSSNRSDFKEFALLGKMINVTVDLNSASCGCNAAFYLTSMPAAAGSPGAGGDWYCDANSVGGNSCPEIDLIEANQNALHTTVHACKSPWNETNCDKGGWNTKFGQGGADFGIGPRFTIDTTETFTVSNAFSTSSNGSLVAVITTITQGSAVITSTLDSILLERAQADIGNGMVLVMSYWGADSMGWLDKPPCASDPVGQCPASITFSDISVDPAPPSAATRKCCSWNADVCGPSDYCNGSEANCKGCGGKWVAPSAVL